MRSTPLARSLSHKRPPHARRNPTLTPVLALHGDTHPDVHNPAPDFYEVLKRIVAGATRDEEYALAPCPEMSDLRAELHGHEDPPCRTGRMATVYLGTLTRSPSDGEDRDAAPDKSGQSASRYALSGLYQGILWYTSGCVHPT